MSGKVFHQVLAFNSPAKADNIYFELDGDSVKGFVTDDSGNGKRIGQNGTEIQAELDDALGTDWRTNSIDAGTF